jgi:DNA-binding MurR/RpiR family transcriptional regulator
MESASKGLFERIIKTYPTLSPKRRRVADLIMRDYKKIFLMTAREIAAECGVSEPTIIRFAVDLGFTGYAEFLQFLKGLLHIELTSAERFAKTSHKGKTGTTIQRYCHNAIRNLEHLSRSISDTELKRIASAIFKAGTVYVVGNRASATLAYHFGYLLKKIRENVFIDTNLSWELTDMLNQADESTLLFVIGFPRYPRRTIEILKYAKECKVKTIGLSDNPKSPVITLADEHVIVDIEGVSFIDPFAHIIVLLGALVHEIAFLDNQEAMDRLSKFDEGVKRTNEFYSVEAFEENLEYRFDGPYVTSLWPQKENV